MARSVKKGPFVDEHLMKKVLAAKEAKSNKPIKTWSRRSTVLPEMIVITSYSIHYTKLYERRHAPVNTVAVLPSLPMRSESLPNGLRKV